MKRTSRDALWFAEFVCVAAFSALALEAGAGALQTASRPPKLVVLDVELTGDLGGPELASAHDARLEMASALLREEIERTSLYKVVDTAPAADLIRRLKSEHRYLHNCSGCDLEVGRQLGADAVLVAWVYRVSTLILSLTYEIHDVSSGQIIARKAFDFRGDNDAAWKHAIRYMVRDLKDKPLGR